MGTYKDLGNISEGIMIRELRRRLHSQGGKNRNISIKTAEECGDEDTEKKCIFCGSKENLYTYKNYCYCYRCYREIISKSLDER